MAPTKDTPDMVVFQMPDGTKVSNDPRFDLQEALQDQLDSTENRGDAGISRAEQEAQMQSIHEAPLQENKVDDPDSLLPTVGSGLQVQKEDVKEAQETGATPPTQENPDSNERVEEARKAAKEAAEKLSAAAEKLPEEGAGDPDTPYEEWKGAQLKYEVARRNTLKAEAGEPLLDMTGVTKRAQVAEKLREDDAAGGSAPADAGSTS